MFNLLKDIDSYQFWEGAKQNKLFIQKSTISKKYFFYSRSFSGVEANEPYEWEEASGKGTIYSFTISTGSFFSCTSSTGSFYFSATSTGSFYSSTTSSFVFYSY